jgi:hypothetical protein
MGADSLQPHFGSPLPALVAINCSTYLCRLDGFTITAAGLPAAMPAVRVYEGLVYGTTIFAGEFDVYGVLGVMDRHGLPTGTWKIT